MTTADPKMCRRAMLALLAGVPLAAWPGPRKPAHASSPHAAVAHKALAPGPATLLIAGPEGGALDRWGGIVQAALNQILPPDAPLTRGTAGGPDGVTGANQFATRGEPDGQTMLLVPPDAVIAWLVGDPRAKYDPGRWTALMAGVTPAVLMLRRGADPKKKPLRIAAPALASTALAGIMAVDLMGWRAEPVLGIALDAQAAIFAAGGVDVVLARGQRVEEQVRLLTQAGGSPVMALGPHWSGPAAGEIPTRDPAFPAVPTVAELLPGPSPLLDAHIAASAAAKLEFALVLPPLTPAARVALWRHAASEALRAPDLQSFAIETGVRAIGGAEASAIAGPTVPSPAALAALHAWLSDRFKFKPA